MRTYFLHRIDTHYSPLLGFVKADTTNIALDEFRAEIRAQQVGTIMELRSGHSQPITLSNDIDHIYSYPEGTADAVVIWSRPAPLR